MFGLFKSREEKERERKVVEVQRLAKEYESLHDEAQVVFDKAVSGGKTKVGEVLDMLDKFSQSYRFLTSFATHVDTGTKPEVIIIEFYNKNKAISEIYLDVPIDEAACNNMLMAIGMMDGVNSMLAQKLVQDFDECLEEIAPEFYEKMQRESNQSEVHDEIGIMRSDGQIEKRTPKDLGSPKNEGGIGFKPSYMKR